MSTATTVCTRCIMDTTAQGIVFDADGVCNYCHSYDRTDRANPTGEEGRRRLDTIVEQIKASNRRGKYDCIIGVSGGTDSTYLLYWAKQVGLRPLAVHCDNGWNTEIAVRNIEGATNQLGIDLFTHVLDWEEFKSLQVAFLKSSTPDADKPTDMALRSVLYRTAAREGIRHILVGVNFRTEGKVPIFWSYGDGRYIASVNRECGTRRLKTYPNFRLKEYGWYGFVRRVKQVRPLWYVEYRKEEVKALLTKELGWEYYGGHHYENIFTRFLHGYYLVEKFGFDKRKVEFSALVRSGQSTRQEALGRLAQVQYTPEMAREDIAYVTKKLGLTDAEFQEIMSATPKSFLGLQLHQLRRHDARLRRQVGQPGCRRGYRSRRGLWWRRHARALSHRSGRWRGFRSGRREHVRLPRTAPRRADQLSHPT